MKLYEIVGLTKTTFSDISYETDSNCFIRKDDTGCGMRKTRLFTRYVLYIRVNHAYYAVHLRLCDCPAFSGKLCSMGWMKIARVNCDDIRKTITHLPIQPLTVCADLGIKKDSDYPDMDVFLHNDLRTYVFQFSRVGGNALNPRGYVHVNMELFQDILGRF